MKRFLSAILASLMLFTMFPFISLAAEGETSEYEELMVLACDVFPEYSSLFLGKEGIPCTQSIRSDANIIVHQETRNISDHESLGLTLFSSGDAIVLHNKNTTYLELTSPNSSTNDIGSVGVYGTATFRVARISEYKEVFELSNVSFTIYYTGSDYFSNFGTVEESSFYKYVLYKPNDDYPNEIEYLLYVSENLWHYIEISIKNDQLIAEVC